MIYRDYHVHTTYCDGKNTAEEMVQAAIKKGLTTIGFSGHSYTPFDEEPCMSLQGTDAYRQEIARLKEKYRGQIEVLCGIEQDYFSPIPPENYDYVIGSVHYVYVNGEYGSIDETPEKFLALAEKHFDGDTLAVAEEYYRLLATVVQKTNADIIGHFDIVAKFNQNNRLFDTTNERYIAAWKAAADALLQTKKPFEINTGGISRGYRCEPYPSPEIIKYLKDNGGTFVLNSDSHRADTLCFEFDKWQPLANV